MGQKIDKKMRATVWSRQEVQLKRRAPLQEVKRDRKALSLDGIMIIAKDANLLKMLILN